MRVVFSLAKLKTLSLGVVPSPGLNILVWSLSRDCSHLPLHLSQALLHGSSSLARPDQLPSAAFQSLFLPDAQVLLTGAHSPGLGSAPIGAVDLLAHRTGAHRNSKLTVRPLLHPPLSFLHSLIHLTGIYLVPTVYQALY